MNRQQTCRRSCFYVGWMRGTLTYNNSLSLDYPLSITSICAIKLACASSLTFLTALSSVNYHNIKIHEQFKIVVAMGMNIDR